MNIFEASRNGNIEEVKRLLEEGVDINEQNFSNGGWTPLFYACIKGHYELVVFLIEHGANQKILTYTDWTVFMGVCSNGHFKIAKFLLKHGANPNDRTNFNLSSLKLAMTSKNPQTALLFYKYSHSLEEDDKELLRKQFYRCSLDS